LHAEFQRIQDRLRKTVIIVTHDMGEAFALGDRVGVLDAGRLVACDRPRVIVGSTNPAVRRLLDAVAVLPLAEAESLRSRPRSDSELGPRRAE
jgi:ABC-type proline/glycine betaine transport system ATPase subunit